MKKKSNFNKEEIIYNIINSLLSGFLVFLGAFTTGEINGEIIGIALATSLIVAITKFKDYWASKPKFKKNCVSCHLFHFV